MVTDANQCVASMVQLQVQPPHQQGIAPRIITGPVMLAKHPVAHRGDVRVVTAVNPADNSSSSRSRSGDAMLLSQSYVNVVVFSQKGERPLPNKLSGSDLVRKLFPTVSGVKQRHAC